MGEHSQKSTFTRKLLVLKKYHCAEDNFTTKNYYFEKSHNVEKNERGPFGFKVSEKLN